MRESDIVRRLALNIRRIRSQQKITQEQLAELSGLHRTYIGMIERCEKTCTIESLEKIAIALKVSPSTLIA